MEVSIHNGRGVGGKQAMSALRTSRGVATRGGGGVYEVWEGRGKGEKSRSNHSEKKYIIGMTAI